MCNQSAETFLEFDKLVPQYHFELQLDLKCIADQVYLFLEHLLMGLPSYCDTNNEATD